MGKVTERLNALINQLDKVKQIDKRAVDRQRRVAEAMSRTAREFEAQREEPPRSEE